VNALVVHAHPEPRSFCAALKATAAEELAALGCEVTISDLYAERFRPDLSADDFTSRERGDFLRPMEEQQHGVTTGTLAPDVAREVDRLRAADLVVFTAPMWWFSVPAMLKGWFDRVLVNGYAYGTVKAWTGPLIDKRAVLAMTCSYEQAGFRAGGSIGELEPLLRPVQHGTLAYCGFQVLEPFMAYAADEVDDGARASMLESFRSMLRLVVEPSTP
jgi:NAD(P)H dehydrogenase (quinone)